MAAQSATKEHLSAAEWRQTMAHGARRCEKIKTAHATTLSRKESQSGSPCFALRALRTLRLCAKLVCSFRDQSTGSEAFRKSGRQSRSQRRRELPIRNGPSPTRPYTRYAASVVGCARYKRRATACRARVSAERMAPKVWALSSRELSLIGGAFSL